MKLLKIILSALAIAYLAGCAMPVTRYDIQSYEIRKKDVDLEKAISKLTGVLVDNGFDVKMANKDAGIVTTEYKKYTWTGVNETGVIPFDYYIQIKAKITSIKGDTIVQLTPIIKEQNRLNPAAFTEHQLSFFTGDQKNVAAIKSMRPGGWRLEGVHVFKKLYNDVAVAFGASKEEIVPNVRNSPDDAMNSSY